MSGKHSRVLFAGILCLAILLAAAAGAAGPAGKPAAWAETASVEEIILKIRADEAWIWDATTFLMRAEGCWEKTPEAIQIELADLKQKHPGEDFDDPRTRMVFWGLQPKVEEQLLLAWDEKRLARAHVMEGIQSEHQAFDGQQVLIHHQDLYERGQEHYALDRSPYRFMSSSAFSDYAIGRLICPEPWWVETNAGARAYIEPPVADYRDEGIQEREGRRYRVITYYAGRPDREHWIDVETGRIEYLKYWFAPHPGKESMEQFLTAKAPLCVEWLVEQLLGEERFKGLAKEILDSRARRPEWPRGFLDRVIAAAGEPVVGGTPADFQKQYVGIWLEVLEDEGFLAGREEEVRARVFERLEAKPDLLQEMGAEVNRKLGDQNPLKPQPFVEHVLKDWREVAPGKFFPFQQGYTMWFSDFEHAGQIQFVRPIRVTRLAVGRPLPEELFAIEMKEGVQVHDWGHEPPLHYKYKKDFPPEEWNQILTEAERQANRNQRQEDEQQALVGQAAPAIAAQKWLNSEPLDWAKLKGKLVIVDFFAEWCGPCRNDFPKMAAWHQDRVGDDLVVLGVHTPGSDEAKIEKLIEQYKLHYPIAIDVPTEKGGYWGKTFAAYRINAIPHSILVDEAGRVIVHGSLSDAMKEANRRMNARAIR